MTVSLTIGMLLMLVLAGTGAINFGGALAQDSPSTVARLQEASPTAESATGTGQMSSAVDVVKAVSPAVVTVVNEQRVGMQNGGSSLQPVGSGTGFIIDQNGHIITNWHVVDGGSKFQVVFADGTTKAATLVGSDEISDLAVVKVDGNVPGVGAAR